MLSVFAVGRGNGRTGQVQSDHLTQTIQSEASTDEIDSKGKKINKHATSHPGSSLVRRGFADHRQLRGAGKKSGTK